MSVLQTVGFIDDQVDPWNTTKTDGNHTITNTSWLHIHNDVLNEILQIIGDDFVSGEQDVELDILGVGIVKLVLADNVTGVLT